MSMFQNEKIKEVANKVENLAIPLEEKVDSIGAKILKSKWTWLIVLGVIGLIAYIF